MPGRAIAADGEDIEITLNYALGGTVPAIFHASTGGEDSNRVEGPLQSRTVRIGNGRERIGDFSLDATGFALVHHETAVTDFHEQAQLEAIYEAEVTELALALTGASRILIFDHTIRTDSAKIRQDRKVRDFVPLVHNDYTDRSARQRLRDLLPAAQAEAALARRFAIINLWRSVGGVVETTPLAICDARTIRESNLLPMERRARDRIGEMQQATFDPGQRWYYFPQMDRDEALIFKTFDSAIDGPARRSLHSAFVNPAAGPHAEPRESIETRLFAFY